MKKTHALARITSFSSMISVYLPCSFCFISCMRSILWWISCQRLALEYESAALQGWPIRHLTLFWEPPGLAPSSLNCCHSRSQPLVRRTVPHRRRHCHVCYVCVAEGHSVRWVGLRVTRFWGSSRVYVKSMSRFYMRQSMQPVLQSRLGRDWKSGLAKKEIWSNLKIVSESFKLWLRSDFVRRCLCPQDEAHQPTYRQTWFCMAFSIIFNPFESW